MFKPVLAGHGPTVTIFVEGNALVVPEGTSVAAAVLRYSIPYARTTAIRHEQRGPFCLMGVCYECLMEIDGVPNQRACLVPVKQDMRVRRQQGAPNFTGIAQSGTEE